MSSSFGPRVSQCEFLIKVFLLYDFSKELFFTFLRHQRGISKGFWSLWFLKGSFLKTVVYYKQDFFRQNQFAPCAGTRATTLKILTIFYSRIFLVGETSSPPIFWLLWIFFCWDIHSLFCSIQLSIFLNTWKNHWVPILSEVQPTVKTGTQLFQQLGDTQKSQVFLKRKNCSGVRPSLFKKEVSFGANYFTLNLPSCADFLCSQ